MSVSPSNSSCSSFSSSSSAEVEFFAALKDKNSFQVQIAGTHGKDKFLIVIKEIGLGQAAGALAGDALESVLIGGNRAFRVRVGWVDDDCDDLDEEERRDLEDWGSVAKLGNWSNFCDADGDLKPATLNIPEDVWQLSYGKIVTYLPDVDDA